MTYFTETERHGRTQIEFDSKRFLADLVAALGGSDADPEYQGGRFNVDGLAVYLRQGYGAKVRRVTVTSGTADKDAHRLAYARGSVPSFPSITIDPDRPLDVLVKDIKRRVIEASAEPMAALAALAAAQADTASQLKAAADRINAKFPGAVTVSGDDTKRNADVYLNGAGSYLSGRLNADGTLYVDRVGSVPAHKVEALLALLTA